MSNLDQATAHQLDLTLSIASVDALMVYLGPSYVSPEDPEGVALSAVAQLVHALNEDLGDSLIEQVPAFSSLFIQYDAQQLSLAELQRTIFKAAEGWHSTDERAQGPGTSKVWDVPVCYEPCVALDLEEFAQALNLSPQAVTELHSQGDYRVGAVGFSPGFAYITGLDPSLQLPRKATPRTSVPAGSLAVAQAYTAIYPQATPGGWWLLGQTPTPFGLAQAKVGDRVRFTPMSHEAFLTATAAVLDENTSPKSTASKVEGLVSSTGKVEVLEAGAMVMVQDLGRRGVQHTGYSQGGVLDLHAAHWANYLLGNHQDAALFEVALSPLKLRFLAPTRIALTGAEVGATLAGQPCKNWASHEIKAGDELCLGWPSQGLRAYVAVLGGFEQPKHLGSRSHVAREANSCVSAGDTLFYASSSNDKASTCWQVPARFQRHYLTPKQQQAALILRLVVGYQGGELSETQWQVIEQNEYSTSHQSDRMGSRLQGPKIELKGEGLASEAIALGAVQVPPDGQPIVLLNDRQTLGGYPKLGSVLPMDLARLAQAVPGIKVRFQRLTLAQAQAATAEFNQFFTP
ncbi:MAG: carboxyltransferase domain-containing protein [Pontibacterium sp.]